MRLLDALEVLVQLLLRVEERAVDALEHRVVLVAAPVGPGDAHQLEAPHLAGASRRAGPGRGRRTRPGGRGRPLVLDPVDQLDLVGLVGEKLARLVFRDLRRLERDVGVDAGAHLLFDHRQVLGRKRARELEVVVEAGIDRRADPELGVREHLQTASAMMCAAEWRMRSRRSSFVISASSGIVLSLQGRCSVGFGILPPLEQLPRSGQHDGRFVHPADHPEGGERRSEAGSPPGQVDGEDGQRPEKRRQWPRCMKKISMPRKRLRFIGSRSRTGKAATSGTPAAPAP